MDQLVQIDEVLGELEQGYSGVFRCLGSDGYYYYVKGHNVDRPDQAKEWLCGNLARAFNLPIADFCLVEIDRYFLNYLPVQYRKIGYGPCFASREVKLAQWPEPYMIAPKVPTELQRDLLVFDYWIRNDDRSKGNPNLLWVPHDEQLMVIDHNLAFDEEFERANFLRTHIFSEVQESVFGDLVSVAEYQSRMEQAMEVYQPAIEVIRQVWPWRDLEETVPFALDSEAFLAILEEYKNPEFWSMK